MSGAGRMARWAGGGALAAVPAWVAGTGTRGLASVLVVTLIAAGTLCWIIADPGRTRRLALLIRAWHASRALPTGTRAPAATSRRKRQSGGST